MMDFYSFIKKNSQIQHFDGIFGPKNQSVQKIKTVQKIKNLLGKNIIFWEFFTVQKIKKSKKSNSPKNQAVLKICSRLIL